MSESDSAEYGMVMPFWIDTPGYTDRDREMFVCGVEFEMIRQELESGKGIRRPIHADNSSRVRMMCHKMGRKYEVRTTVQPEWADLLVWPKS